MPARLTPLNQIRTVTTQNDIGKVICPKCGKGTAAGAQCEHCGTALGTNKPRLLRPSDAPTADFGIYLLAIPIIAAIAALAVALAQHSVTGIIVVLVIMAVVSAGFATVELFRAPTLLDVKEPTKTIFGWLGFILILWPAGFPAYSFSRRRFHLGNLIVAAVIVEVILIVGVVLSGVIIHTGYGKPTARQLETQKKHEYPGLLQTSPRWIPDPGDVQLVKTSYLDNCRQRTVEQEVNAYFGSPRWEAGADSQGRDFVNITGTVTYRSKPVPAVFQFLIDADRQGFKYHAFTINGVPQTIYVAALTLAEMCAAANRAPIVLVPQGPSAL